MFAFYENDGIIIKQKEVIMNVISNTKFSCQNISEMFKSQWWIFVIAMSCVVIGLFIIKMLSKGRLFKIRTIIKVVINCALAFVLLFVINFFGGLFTKGAWAFTPKWYSWIIIGVFGIIGLIFLIVSCFVWPDVLVTTVAS